MPDWAKVRRTIGVAAVTFVLVVGVLYAGVCVLFWKYDRAFVFAQVPRPRIAPQAAGLAGFAEVTVTTEDGVPLFGWWKPPEPGRGAIVPDRPGSSSSPSRRRVWGRGCAGRSRAAARCSRTSTARCCRKRRCESSPCRSAPAANICFRRSSSIPVVKLLRSRSAQIVIPAKAGIHRAAMRAAEMWIPAFAGMTMRVGLETGKSSESAL